MTQPTLGVCYYPEHWPESRWAEDARRMAALGLTYVRVGEFAWSRLEPEPGAVDTEWLQQAIETLAGAGLKVVLGTPTATPPKWLVDSMPDMVAIDEMDRPRRFGSRRHYCFSHAGYRQECVRIVETLVRRLGDHPGIAAWQTDNEYGCHNTVLSYSASALEGFRRWLEERYGDIGALNDAWGTAFWSMTYRSFAEIDLPNLTVTEAHPAHRLDFWRYSSDQVAAFDAAQVEILRQFSPGCLILHNYMGRFADFDHFKVAAGHDGATWDSYPIGFLSERREREPEHATRFVRQGDPDFQAFHHDLYRAVGRGRLWVMEQQPGPVNWAPWNPAPLPGMVRLWSMEAFAHGAETVSYFRWRQAPFGQEQMHTGLLRPDSSHDAAVAEVSSVAADIASLGTFEEVSQAPVAIVFDYPSDWAWRIQPQGADFNYTDLIFETYRALRRAGLTIDIVSSHAEDWSGYHAVFVPGLFAWTRETLKALSRFEGIAIIGPRTGSRDRNFRIPDDLPPILPEHVLNARVITTQSLPPEIAIDAGGRNGHFIRWFETLAHGEGVEPVFKTPEGPGLLRQDRIRYLAGWPDAKLFDRMVADIAADTGIAITTLPDGLRRRDLGSWRFWFNYAPTQVDIRRYGAKTPVLLDGPVLKPAGVALEQRG